MSKIIQTEDGSSTLYTEQFKEHYHSIHGAEQESQLIYIAYGLGERLKILGAELNRPLKILEMGFGTGLNAWLSLLMIETKDIPIHYTTIEKYPISLEIAERLSYAKSSEEKALFLGLHQAEWGKEFVITPKFTIKKLEIDLLDFDARGAKFDLIYFDAFSPDTQAELWEEEVFQNLAKLSRKGAILTTYCAKGLIALLLCLTFVIIRLFNMTEQKENLHYPDETPSLDSCYAKGVSGAVAGILFDETSKKEYLILAGGANFPHKPASESGKKVYYNQIYAYDLSQANAEWIEVGILPQANAYAGFTSYNNALYVVGGASSNGASDRAYQIKLQNKKAIIKELPRLPYKFTDAKLIRFKEQFYLLGGSTNGVMSNKMLSLKDKSKTWQEEKAYPHSPYLKTLAISDKDYLYLWGSFPHEEYGRAEEFLDSPYLHKYNPNTKEWESDAIEDDELSYLPSFGGGMAYYNEKEDVLVFLGGVNKERFLPALKRGEALAKALKENDESLIKQYKKEIKDYLNQPVTWHNFNQKAYRFNKQELYFEQGASKKAFARADACLVKHGNQFLIIGGELKPGIRTRQISIHQL